MTMMEEILILSCADEADGGGIYRCRLGDEGTVTPLSYLPCPKPMYAVMDGGRLHVLLRAPFPDSENSGYFSCLSDFSERTEVRDTLGKCACHLAVGGGDVYVTNYLSGNLVKNGRDVVTHHGRGVNLPRQDMPHTHFAALSPDRQYVLSCDLGRDTIFVYDRDLHEISRAKVPDGYGVRHLTFSADGRYFFAVNELVPSVSTFAWDDGRATCIGTVPLACTVPGATAAAIRYDETESKLYISVRGEDKIFVFDIDEGHLTLRGSAPCGGRGPRDFALFGDKIVCTNENSDSVTVLDKERLRVLGSGTFPAPLCVLKAGDTHEF